MNLKKIAPWNWFKQEEQEKHESHRLPARHGESLSKATMKGNPLAVLRGEMDRLFDDFGRGNWLSYGPDFDSMFETAGLFQPSIDVSESNRKYTVKVEVPGVEKDDIHVEVEDDRLVLYGEKKREHEEKEENYHRIERSYGSFRRILNLPPDAVPGDIKAKFRNGVLTLTMPRNKELPSSTRAIEVEVD